MKLCRVHILVAFLALTLALLVFRAKILPVVSGMIPVKGGKSVSERLTDLGAPVLKRVRARFANIGVAYPPRNIVLVGLKQERVLEVWAADDGRKFRHLNTYSILGASGTLGPKLREGDRQVPEGLYQIESLNPNSRYHLALRVNYPNNFDRAKGRLDGRVNLGSDIMIHGGSASVGCLAIGDEAAEDLFLLASQTGIEHVSVILSPVDFRNRDLPEKIFDAPQWAPELYTLIRHELRKLQRNN